MADVRFKNGRRLGKVEEYFASTLTPGDTFAFAGLSLEVEAIRDTDLIVRATTRPARIPSYMGARLAISTRLADRVRRSEEHTSELQSLMRTSYAVFRLRKKN